MPPRPSQAPVLSAITVPLYRWKSQGSGENGLQEHRILFIQGSPEAHQAPASSPHPYCCDTGLLVLLVWKGAECPGLCICHVPSAHPVLGAVDKLRSRMAQGLA